MILYGPFDEILTLAGLSLRGPIPDASLEIIEKGGVLVSEDRIMKIGRYHELKKAYPTAEPVGDQVGGVVLPGFIDAHTHLCWYANRAADYADRLSGLSYLEIAHRGGGIWSSVMKTREAKVDELVSLTIERANRHLKDGITTIEVKSGYGLSVEAEVKILKSVKQANDKVQADLISTCLAAHIKPHDFEGSSSEYLNHIQNELWPILSAENLTKRIDIFIEESAFGVEESFDYLNAASQAGFDLTVHGDQFSCGGSEVAMNVGAQSVDHLEASGSKEIDMLAASSVVGVALPGASLGLGMKYTPARQLLDAGGSLAIASDWNPGSAPMGDLLMQAAVLGAAERLTTAETLAGLTSRAAHALGLTDRGVLTPGAKADFQVYAVNDHREILYNQGRLKPNQVVKNGRICE